MEKGHVLDALIIGAGFSGLNMLLNLRKLGFSAKIYETASYLGGAWFWNRYPGAGVDSDTPIYQLMKEKEVWCGFEFKTRFPSREELMRYFRHADKILGLSKDITYNTFVTSADFDDEANIWHIKTDTGISTCTRYLILCTGLHSKRYIPAFNGLDKFKGKCYHSSSWPEDGIDMVGKHVAIVGTAASSVQLTQKIGTEVAHLTVYQRTPALAIPLQQRLFNNYERDTTSPCVSEWQYPDKTEYENIFNQLKFTFGGFRKNFYAEKFENVTPTERQKVYENAWTQGGCAFWMYGFFETFISQEANDEVYAFLANKIRARIHNPIKRDLLVPLNPPHAWGTKRPSLETSYYDVLNQNNVDIIDVNASPIIEVTENGIKTKKEGVVSVDIIIFATGFDSLTGGILDINIRNGKGISIKEKWRKGTKSYLGVCASDFPNLFWVYGPHGPADFANAPTSIGIQCDWIADLLLEMQKNGQTRIVADENMEKIWTHHVHLLWKNSLFPATKSWYQGSNIPGKIEEPLCYIGGIPLYTEKLNSCTENNYEGFIIV